MSLTIHLLDTSPLGKLPKNYEQASEFQGKLDDMPSETPSANIVAFAKAITNKWPLTADIDTDADEAPEVVWSPDTEPLLNALRNNEAHTITLGWTTGFEPPYKKEAAMLDMIETALENNLTVLDHQLCHAYFPNGKASPREAGTYLKTMRAYAGESEPEKHITQKACLKLIKSQIAPMMQTHGFEYRDGEHGDSMYWRKAFEGGGVVMYMQVYKKRGFFDENGREPFVTIPFVRLYLDIFDNKANNEFYGHPHENNRVFTEERRHHSTMSLYPLEIFKAQGEAIKIDNSKKLYIDVEQPEGREELTRVMRLFVPWVVQITSVGKLVHEITEGEAQCMLKKMKRQVPFLLQLSMVNPSLFEKFSKEYIDGYYDILSVREKFIQDPEALEKRMNEIKDEVQRAREVGQKYYKILNG